MIRATKPQKVEPPRAAWRPADRQMPTRLHVRKTIVSDESEKCPCKSLQIATGPETRRHKRSNGEDDVDRDAVDPIASGQRQLPAPMALQIRPFGQLFIFGDAAIRIVPRHGLRVTHALIPPFGTSGLFQRRGGVATDNYQSTPMRRDVQ